MLLQNKYDPTFVRSLKQEEKSALAAELRSRILRTVCKTGGHLASSLGAVELTVALHSILDLNNDKLIFDVGHQCYAHKLLTGRVDSFDSLRQKNGVSGFTRITESSYDFVNSGHASDSISLALGFARARDLNRQNHKIAIVLGDGAFTGGMCFEALNDACQKPTQLLIVLNDNEMSISKNVGAFSKHLTRLRQSVGYHSLKKTIRQILKPTSGLYRFLGNAKDALKALLIRNDMMFEALGAQYLGPVDGHNISEMERTFTAALKYDKPVIVHVLTKKGKGYGPAESNPGQFHGTGPFDMTTGKPLSKPYKTCGETAADELISIAENDKRIVCISAAMLAGTGLEAFAERYPDRCWDVGIAEEHAAALAGGLGLGGLKPCLALYSTFLQRAYDQININICLNGSPVLMLIDRAGLNGPDGETHQGVYDVGLLKGIPGIVIACPSSKAQLKRLVRLGCEADVPFAIRYPKKLPEGEMNESVYTGKWRMVVNGSDVCIIASGRMLSVAEEAIKTLQASGINPGLADACFIKPLDADMLRRISESYSCVVTVEDNMISGGLGESIMAEVGNDVTVYIMGVCDDFIPAGTVSEQLEMCGLTAGDIAETVKRAWREKHDA